jgi:uncharacterized protein (TIGR01741 family)
MINGKDENSKIDKEVNNMNANRLEMIYQKIAEQLQEIIPEEWDKIFLYAEINEDMRNVYFNYYPKSSSKSVYCHDIAEDFGISEDVYETLFNNLVDFLGELWGEFKDSDVELWTNCTFILSNNGKFNIEYDYTDLSNTSPRKMHIIWDYKYLGIEPKDDNDKKIIKEYLKSIGN